MAATPASSYFIVVIISEKMNRGRLHQILNKNNWSG